MVFLFFCFCLSLWYHRDSIFLAAMHWSSDMWMRSLNPKSCANIRIHLLCAKSYLPWCHLFVNAMRFWNSNNLATFLYFMDARSTRWYALHSRALVVFCMIAYAAYDSTATICMHQHCCAWLGKNKNFFSALLLSARFACRRRCLRASDDALEDKAMFAD